MFNNNTQQENAFNNSNAAAESTMNTFHMLCSKSLKELKSLLWKLRVLNIFGNLLIAIAILFFSYPFYNLSNGFKDTITDTDFFLWSLPLLLLTLLTCAQGIALKKKHTIKYKKMLFYFTIAILTVAFSSLISSFYLQKEETRAIVGISSVILTIFCMVMIYILRTPDLFGPFAPTLSQLKFFVSTQKNGQKEINFSKFPSSSPTQKTDFIIFCAATAHTFLLFLALCLSIYLFWSDDLRYQNSLLGDRRSKQEAVNAVKDAEDKLRSVENKLHEYYILEGEKELLRQNYGKAYDIYNHISSNRFLFDEFSFEQSVLMLAYFNLEGIGCKTNYTAALSYLYTRENFGDSRILEGNPKAAYLWGKIFYFGYGVKQDFAKAAKCFQEAAQGGCEEAKVLLSCKNELPPYKNVSFEEFLRQKYYGAFPKEAKPESTIEKDSKKAESEPAKGKGNEENSSQQNKK